MYSRFPHQLGQRGQLLIKVDGAGPAGCALLHGLSGLTPRQGVRRLTVIAPIFVAHGQGNGLSAAGVEGSVRGDGLGDAVVGADHGGSASHSGVDVKQLTDLLFQLDGDLARVFGGVGDCVGGTAGHSDSLCRYLCVEKF